MIKRNNSNYLQDYLTIHCYAGQYSQKSLSILRIESSIKMKKPVAGVSFQIIGVKTMPYEPGSTQCLGLIAAKENLLNAMSSLNNIENIGHIHLKLKEIYKELDAIHEGRKIIENEF